MGQRDRAVRPAPSVASHRNRIACHVRADQPKDLGENEIEFVASTAQVASDGKVIREAAWQSSVDRVRAGGRVPKVFAAHQAAYPDGRQPVIGLIPPESIRIEAGVGLVHRIRFATEDVHPEGPRYFAAYRDGYLDAVSVGWDKERLAPEAEWADREIPEVSDLEWLETSCVGIGADEGAVKRARAAGQYDVATLLTALRPKDAMRRTITKDHPSCPAGKPFALVASDGKVLGCHGSEAEAQAQESAIAAQEATRAHNMQAMCAACAEECQRCAEVCRAAAECEHCKAACEACAAACDACATACLDPNLDADACMELCRQCAETCQACAQTCESCETDHSACLIACVACAAACAACAQMAPAPEGGEDEDAAEEPEASVAADGAAAATPAQHAWAPRRTRLVAHALSAGDVSARLGNAPATRAALAKTFSQYLSAGQDRLVTPTDEGSHAPKLASGGYALVGAMRSPGFGFLPVRAETDALAIFAEHPAERVLAEIDAFWSLGARYAKFGLQHRRGLLLYGEPGTGKTACLHLVRAHMAAAGEVVIDASTADPWMLREALHAIREVEPERPITVIVEDIERWGSHGETELLALLDGQHSIGRCLLIASTNYRDQMSPRMLRAGRFDLHVEVGPPSAVGRSAYFTAKLANAAVTPETVADLTERTDGWTYSQMRELILAHFAHGQALDEACARIVDDVSAPPSLGESLRVESTDPAGLERLADTVQAFAADRSDAAQDTRCMVHEIREAVDAMQRTLATLPQALAQAVTEAVMAERQKPPGTVTMRVSAVSPADAEDNERARVSALLGDLTILNQETKRLSGAAATR